MNEHKLVSAPIARRDYFGGITSMTEHRWRKAGILPQPIKIRKRCYYRESDLIEFQARFEQGDRAPA